MIYGVQLRGLQSPLDMLIPFKWLRGERHANLRNITPIHGVSSPKMLLHALSPARRLLQFVAY